MREIKFQVMTIGGEWKTYSLGDLACGDAVTHEGLQLSPDTWRQFTGFRDPDGAEIYERDIVYIAKAKEHREIRFSDGGFRIFAADGDSWPMNQERALGLMVDGNAFENPELLTA